jgi:2'-hydroxyisoflavone reductase
MHTAAEIPAQVGEGPGSPGGNLLVLGGTGWLSGLIAKAAVARGANVTCLARGTTGKVPDGARLVRADRTQPGAYREVAGADWDDVVDVTRDAGQAESVVAALAGRAAHWTYVSSGAARLVGARRPDAAPGVPAPGRPGENAPRGEYPLAKLASERAVLAGMGDRAAVVRVGLIGGPGDVSDRTGYWPARFRVAGDGPVLVPAADEQDVRFIDARDFALWLSGPAAACTGIFQAEGPARPLRQILHGAARAADFGGEWVRASTESLTALGIRPWMGPRSLPLWATAAFGPPPAASEDAEPMAPGLTHRPLADVMCDTLQDEIRRGLDRPRKSGLTRDEELAAIKQLKQNADRSS